MNLDSRPIGPCVECGAEPGCNIDCSTCMEEPNESAAWRLDNPKDMSPDCLRDGYHCIAAGNGRPRDGGFTISGFMSARHARLIAAAARLLGVVKIALPALERDLEELEEMAADWPENKDGPIAVAAARSRRDLANQLIAFVENGP